MPQQDRREQILMAALHCFNEHGVEATAMNTICQRATASVGSVYHHFGSKEGIVRALLVEGMASNASLLKQHLAQSQGAEAGVRAIVSSLIEWIATHPEWAKFIYSVSRDGLKDMGGDELKQVTQGYMTRLESYFNDCDELHLIQSLPKDCLVAILVGPVHHFAKRWLNSRQEQSIQAYTEIFSNAAWNALKVQPG